MPVMPFLERCAKHSLRRSRKAFRAPVRQCIPRPPRALKAFAIFDAARTAAQVLATLWDTVPCGS